MRVIFNSSPLIFLSSLGFLEVFLETSDDFYVPKLVSDEISTKRDQANKAISQLIRSERLKLQQSNLITLINSLNQRLGSGESEAIALGIELTADYVILDDFAARREASRLGLTVKGTLAIIRKLKSENKISVGSLDELYQNLLEINFRVKRSLFDQIFVDEINL